MTRSEDIVAILPVIGALALTHKFPILVAALVLLALAAGSWLGVFSNRKNPAALFALSAVILLSVWSLLTPFTVDVVMLGTLLLQEGIEFGGTLAEPTAATRVQNSIWYTIGRNLHWLALVAVSGLGWIVLAYRVWSEQYSRYRSDALIILLCSAILVALLVAGIFGAAGSLNPIRVVFLATIPLVVLIVGFIDSIDSKTRRSVAITVLIVMVATQAVAVGNFPDDSGPRDYLTTSEQEGKDHAKAYSTESVYTDSYYSRAGVNPQDPGEWYWNRDRGQFRSYDSAVYNGSVSPLEPEYIAYRTSVDTYGHVPWGGYWDLQWHPQSDLRGCGNQIYSNGGVDMYASGQCWGETEE